MSRKPKTTAPQEEARPALVPKLRFPEFRKLAGWPPTPLKSIADPVTERATQGDEDNVLSLSAEHGIVLQSEFFGKKVAGDNSERYLKIARNDFVYNDRTTKASTFGTIKRLSKHSGGIVSPIYKCFRFHADENPVFWEQYFESGSHEAALRGLVNEGARAGRFNISISQFLSTAACRPDEAEQQKIAECLSSVDELIAAQARKLESLKTHKKGLMQQLFPREGETQPRLRFPEFQNAGAWEVKRVDEQGSVLAGKALAANAPGPQRPYLRTKNVLDGAIDLSDVLTMPMTDAEFTRFEILDGDVLLNEGQSLELVGRASIYCGEFGQRCAIQNALLRFRAFPSTSAEFAAQYFRQCQKDGTFANVATKTTSVAHLGSSRFSALELAWPTPAEQHRIATCLSSLDALIAAETHKHAALQRHKRGLMQQLFPSPEDTTNP
jgi:type I restriction enzyme S subunit